MAWLLRRGEVLASLEVAHSLAARMRGFGGREQERSALLIVPARVPHSLGTRCSLDIGYLDKELRVLATTNLAPRRVALPRRRVAALLQVEAGAFDRWGLQTGDVLEVKS